MPTLQTLDQAMLRASTSLPILGRIGGGQIALVEGRQPWRTVGLDNAVYVLWQPGGRMLAMRIPLAEGDAHVQADHYRALGSDPRLAALKEAPGSPVAPRVAWYPDGLLLPARDLRSSPHPVIVLDWVDGPTLIAAVGRACRAGDGAALSGLADSWARAMGLLATHGFVHGDLAGDNVVVRADGTMALLDYDTAIWPGGPSAPVGRGNPAYGHPSGLPHPSPGRRDDFAALLVYISLRALAARPDLRPQFGDATSEPGGALLWRPWDLANPEKSPVFASLANVGPELAELVRVFRRALGGPVEQFPRLADVLGTSRHVTGNTELPRRPEPEATSPQVRGRPAPEVRPLVPARPVPPQIAPSGRPPGVGDVARSKQASLTRLNGFLMAGDDEGALGFWRGSGLSRDAETVRDYAPRIRELEQRLAVGQVRAAAAANDSVAVLRLWRDAGLDGAPVARDVVPMFETARRRVAQAERLRIALDSGDQEDVATLWSNLRGDPLVAAEAARVAQILGQKLTEQVNYAITRHDDRAILAAVAAAEAAAVPIGPDARRANRTATRREATRRTLATAHRDGDEAVLAELAVTGRLDELGRLDPATSRAAQRALRRPALTDALAGDDDWVIAAAYEAQAGLHDETSLVSDERARIELAQARLTWLAEVRSALRKRDIVALKTVTRASPPGAVARLSEIERTRIERLSRRDVTVRRLERLLREGTDREILEALAAMKETGAEFPAGFDWATLRAVEERTELADGILAALGANPPDLDRLATLLPAAKAAVEAGNPPIIPGTSLEQVERDVLRAAQIARVRDAIATGDDQTIMSVAMPDPSQILVALSVAERERVWRAVAAASTPV